MTLLRETAEKFGQSLDNDDFDLAIELISDDCKYVIGSSTLIGPVKICNSYEQNMIDGRNKLDGLEWGKSRIESISNSEFYVHFTDYLTHKKVKYVHRCKQKLTIDTNGKITNIKHVEDKDEQDRLSRFYAEVGLGDA